jgi:hypothetical protein
MSISFSVRRLWCRRLTTTVVGAGGGSVSVVFEFGKDAPVRAVRRVPAH